MSSSLATPWTAARQAPLSFTVSQSLLKFMSIESVLLSNHLILCLFLLLPWILPSIRVFSHELVLHIRWPKYWSFSFRIILPNNIQVDFLYNWLVSSKGHSRVFSSNTIQKHLFYSAQPYFSSSFHIHASVKFSRSVVSKCLWSHGLQYARPPCPATTPGAYSNSCPSCQWCLPTISSSVIPFSSCFQSFPVSGSFPISSSHQVAKVLEFQLQHQSFQRIFRTIFL